MCVSLRAIYLHLVLEVHKLFSLSLPGVFLLRYVKNCLQGTRWVHGHVLCTCMCIHSIAIISTGLSTPVEMNSSWSQFLFTCTMTSTLPHRSAISPQNYGLLFVSLPQARQLCIQLLSSYAYLTFVCVILQTLTKLAVATLVHVSDQVSSYCHNLIQMFMIAWCHTLSEFFVLFLCSWICCWSTQGKTREERSEWWH